MRPCMKQRKKKLIGEVFQVIMSLIHRERQDVISSTYSALNSFVRYTVLIWKINRKRAGSIMNDGIQIWILGHMSTKVPRYKNVTPNKDKLFKVTKERQG